MATIAGAIVQVGGGFHASQGTITADKQVLTGTVTWNNAGVQFTAIYLDITDTASNANSYFVDFRVGSVQKFSVTKAGALTIAVSVTAPTGTFTTAMTVSGTGGWTAGGVAGTNRIDYGNSVANTFALLNSGNAAAGIAVAGLTSQTTLVAVATGTPFKYGVTAATAVAVASTHKIEVRDTAGTTYYLLATT